MRETSPPCNVAGCGNSGGRGGGRWRDGGSAISRAVKIAVVIQGRIQREFNEARETICAICNF